MPGGGSGCQPGVMYSSTVYTVTAPEGVTTGTFTVSGTNASSGIVVPEVPVCFGNGGVVLPFGHPVYIFMGAAVFGSLLVIEIFGSPFLRNIQVSNLSLLPAYGSGFGVLSIWRTHLCW